MKIINNRNINRLVLIILFFMISTNLFGMSRILNFWIQALIAAVCYIELTTEDAYLPKVVYGI
jgi:hypothetical protein